MVFLRVSAIMITIPVFGEAFVPARVKVGLSLLMAMLLFPVLELPAIKSSFDLFSLVLRIGGEILIGVFIGFTAKLIFAGIQLAGQLIGFQMGFAIANVIDPTRGSQISVIAEFQYMLALLLFLLMDGHHIFLYAIAESFRIIPPLGFHYSGQILQTMIGFINNMFVIAVKVGAPIIAILFFVSIGLGMIARTVPQINVFVVGFPLQIAVGLIGIGLTLPFFLKIVAGSFLQLQGEVSLLLNMMK